MAKLTLDTVTGGYDLSVINNNFDKIETAIENTLSRDGTAPNTLEDDLDVNGNRLYNVASLSVGSLSVGGQTVVPGDVNITGIEERENYAAIRAYTGTEVTFYVKGHTLPLDGGAGVFRYDASDVVSSDNGGTILVDASNRRWKRDFNGPVFAKWFSGVTGDAQIRSALAAHSVISLGNSSDNYGCSASITIPSGRTILGGFATLTRTAGAGQFDILKNSDQIGGNTDIVIRDVIVNGNSAVDALDPATPAHRFSGISFKNVTGESAVIGCFVTGTINNETGGSIYIDTCQDVLIERNTVTDNNRSGIVYFNGARNSFVNNTCYSNAGSGIVGGNCVDASFINNKCYNNGSAGTHTGLNASCPRARVIGNLSYSNTGSGIAIGELAYPSDDAECIGNICYSNTLEGITVQYSDRVRLSTNKVHANVRNNIRVLNGSDECQIIGNTVRDSAGGQGIYLDDGARHIVVGNILKGNAVVGLNIDSTATDGICANNEIVNNGAVTSANSAGVLANTTTGWTIANNRIYDTAGAGGTQESGIWVAGGSNNTVSGNILTTNKTNSIRETSSPSYERRFNKVGTDPMRGTFTATAASASTVVANNNATAGSRIKVWPLVTASWTRKVAVSSVSVGVSFTVSTADGNFVGTETYAYEIE